jgi:hypothetical protein
MTVGDSEIFGGEIGFDVLITSWLKVFLKYFYQKLKGDVFAEVVSALALSVPGRSMLGTAFAPFGRSAVGDKPQIAPPHA